MEIQQLKLLAGRIRDLLEQSSVNVTHSQALELSSALPGLRNWSEVMAFPGRVAALELDLSATRRLAFRLQKRYGLELTAEDLLNTLQPSETRSEEDGAPQLWPTGPRPGVYVTTDGDAIDRLLEAYAEATDGALVYAEEAGRHWEASIALGDDGLWSQGLDRVPSGTLVVVGPLELDQQSWKRGAERLEYACLGAMLNGHRVAVLVRTPSADTLFNDLVAMVQSVQPEDACNEEALLGVVAPDGSLVERTPFATALPPLIAAPCSADLAPIPPAALPHLEKALRRRSTGLLLVGSDTIQEHWAVDLVNAMLGLTNTAGPAARIMPRRRSTPAKDWQVPIALKALPFLPSIEAAYAQGYRRMVISPAYTRSEVLLEYGDEVLFIAGGYGSSVDDIYLDAFRSGPSENSRLGISTLVSVLAVTRVQNSKTDVALCDLYVPSAPAELSAKSAFSAVVNHLRDNRLLKVEDGLDQLLGSKLVTPASLKKALPRSRWLPEYLEERKRASPKQT